MQVLVSKIVFVCNLSADTTTVNCRNVTEVMEKIRGDCQTISLQYIFQHLTLGADKLVFVVMSLL